MNIDISYKVDDEKIKAAAEQLSKSPMEIMREIEKASTEAGRKLFRTIISKAKVAEDDVSFVNFFHSDGLLYLPFQIKGYPVDRIVGGIKVDSKNKETKEMETSHFLLASTYGSYLMFRVDGDNAVWCGGLNGTVQERFQAAKFGGRFRYYSTIYQKLRPDQILKMYDPDKVYAYKVENE
jgi:hypothetical protein